ncbi:MAG: hypothetical protein OFPII_25900 [Osedax symbiont Rs1]|nr:MAG: hypothetical protein OFPII_25900 [Osedax symbiont Rs1]
MEFLDKKSLCEYIESIMQSDEQPLRAVGVLLGNVLFYEASAQRCERR